MLGGTLFSATITAVTATVSIPGNNLRFYTDVYAANTSCVAIGFRLVIVPKGETKAEKHVMFSAPEIPGRTTGLVRSILLSSGDNLFMSRITVTATVSNCGILTFPMVFTVQARELVI